MLAQNFDLLLKRFPYLIGQLPKDHSRSDLLLEVSRSKTGLPVARVTRNNRRVFLNSAYDPELDAGRWVDNAVEKADGCCILCGAGFFYHVKALLALERFKKVIIYEPSPEILQAALNEVDIEPLGKYPNFLLLTGTDYDQLISLILGFLNTDLTYITGHFQVKTLTAYNELFEAEIAIFHDKLRQLIHMIQVNLSTTDYFAKQWLVNGFATFRNAAASPVIRHYFGEFKNVPAIIVSAGPSLEKNIHQIETLKEKALIICAGTSIRAMSHFGVSPHFLVGIDGGDYNIKVYEGLDLGDVYLIYNLRFHHHVASNFPGRKILMKLDVENLADFFIAENGGYEIGTLKSGFSCAHTALDLAFNLGCDPVIFIGQDLAYSAVNPKLYAEGQLNYSHPAFHLQPGQLPADGFLTKDIYGRDVVTDYKLDSMRRLFQHLIETVYQGKVNLINATEGGQHIKGTTDRNLDDVIAEYCRDDRNINERIQLLYDRGIKEIKKYRIDPATFCSRLKALNNRTAIKMGELLNRLQDLRKRNFNNRFAPEQWDEILNQISNEYDAALGSKEYRILLRDLQAASVSVNKTRLAEFGATASPEEYDRKLQVCLNIIVETQKELELLQECISSVLNQYQNDTPTYREEVVPDYKTIENQIKQRINLPVLRQKLESVIRNPKAPDRETGLYLYGFVLDRLGQEFEAVSTLEEAAKTESVKAKTYFLLGRIYYKLQNYDKALDSLEHCCELNYKLKYCRKMQLKINYQAQNWVAVNNLLAGHGSEFSGKKALLIVRAECLCRLNLNLEAGKIYRDLIAKYKIPPWINSFLQSLLAQETVSQYRQVYQKNQSFFKEKPDLALPDFETVQYKVCRFLNGEFVCDNHSGMIMAGVNQVEGLQVSLGLTDCLAIHNTDNTKIFDLLYELLDRNEDAAYRKFLRRLPVYIIDDDHEKWCYLAQLFDFSLLREWENLHYCINPGFEGLKRIFMVEEAPWPNVFYGTGKEEFDQYLATIKQAKDGIMQQRLQELQLYYQEISAMRPEKILIIASKKEELLFNYGQALQVCLNGTGFQCFLHSESNSYQCFTAYGDVKLMAEFRPDLVIHLFAFQEELELFKSLNVPFISWLLTEQQLPKGLPQFCRDQTIWLTGNLQVKNILLDKGYRECQIKPVPLPVLPMNTSMETAGIENRNGIAIIGDLVDPEKAIKYLARIIHDFLAAKTGAGRQNIEESLKAVYFQISSQQSNQDLKYPPLPIYEKLLAENFKRGRLEIGSDELKSIAIHVREAFNDLYFQRLQVKWAIQELPLQSVALYGAGWEDDPDLKHFYKGELNPRTRPEQFQTVVLENKINLYLRSQLKNNSYLQPDLIQGIARGGFFMTNDLLVKEYGGDTLASFNGLLDTYGSKNEMLEKLNYYLTHEDDRASRVKMLQNHVNDNFALDKLLQTLLEDYASKHKALQ